MIRRSTRHDKAPNARYARCLGAVRAACARRLGSGCAPGTPNPVLTQCTVLSHCFGTLFMNTVHEVFQKNKIKSN